MAALPAAATTAHHTNLVPELLHGVPSVHSRAVPLSMPDNGHELGGLVHGVSYDSLPFLLLLRKLFQLHQLLPCYGRWRVARYRRVIGSAMASVVV